MSDYVVLFFITFFGTASIVMFYYALIWRQFEKQAAKVLASLPENVTGMGPWTREYLQVRETIDYINKARFRVNQNNYQESTEQLYKDGKPLLATDCYIVDGKTIFIYKI